MVVLYLPAIQSLQSGEDVRISKRLFIPSKRLRGFESGKIGPVDADDFVGGNYAASLNASTTVPYLLQNVQNVDLKQIKNLINNFQILNESYRKDEYNAEIKIFYNESRVKNFLREKNISFSRPENISVIFYPVLFIDNEIQNFNENYFYNNWIKTKIENELINFILPLEDLEDISKILESELKKEKVRLLVEQEIECVEKKSGFVEADGKHYKQVKTEVRPKPFASFKDRLYAVAMSSHSVAKVAALGAVMMSFAQKPWEEMTDHFGTYRDLFKEHHNRPAPPPICVDFMSCDESGDRAEELAREHMANYYVTVLDHYEMANDHFDSIKGYDDYASGAEQLRETGNEAAGEAFVDINTWGTPQQILEKLESRKKALGDFDLTIQVSYGGMTLENAEKSIKLFAEKVLPEVQSWSRVGEKVA